MKIAVSAPVALTAIFVCAGCQHATSPRPAAASQAAVAPAPLDASLAPSPRLIVGRVIATDPDRGFAFIELASDAPATALAPDTELLVRTLELQPTARLRVSRYLRGRTLGTTVLAGKPSPGDEVVWLAP